MPQKQQRRVLITGGAGFVGSNLAIALKTLHPEWTIVALDNLRRRGSEFNLPRFKQVGVEFIHGDIRNSEDLDPNVIAPDLILECSAEPSVLAGYTSPGYVLQTNLIGTVNCLELARITQADFIFLSTSRVYPIPHLTNLNYQETETRFQLMEQPHIAGVTAAGIRESFPLDGHRSLYGATKLASELLIEEYAQAYGLRTVINRCGVITGPWQMGKVDQGVFALWMFAHYFKKSLKYIGFGGTGKQVRDFIHVDDLYDLIQLQISQIDVIKGMIFNIGGGLDHSLSLLETTQLCEEVTGNRIEIVSVPEERQGDIPIFITDSSKIKSTLNWQPKRDARCTLFDIYQWISQNETILTHL